METNYTHYKKEIDELFEKKETIGFDVVTNRVCACVDIDNCDKCKFTSTYDLSHCANRFATWLVSEYKGPAEDVDWSKVPVDTHVLVRDRDDQPWMRRYFAKYENGKFYVFAYGRTLWGDNGEMDITHWKNIKLANPEDCKSAFHAEEKELTKDELMNKLAAQYNDPGDRQTYREIIGAVNWFMNSTIAQEKKDKIVGAVMLLLDMEE